ncbi:MAG: hypothetical protein CM1200mP20_02330 [Pseudomonadota bacterium]|nr:MAG: hypothetical protein CM1200mP20_02330 [Pseudomonadota bacterium]
MLIGVPKEIKNHEYRVGLAPASVREVAAQGHRVIVQTLAGEGIGATDEDYRAAGATITNDPPEAFSADMIVKVKEPQAPERAMLRKGPDSVYLPSSGARSRANFRSRQKRRHMHRL